MTESYNYSVSPGEKCLWCGKQNESDTKDFCCRVCLLYKEYSTDINGIEIGGLIEMNKRLTSKLEDLEKRVLNMQWKLGDI